MKAFGIDLGTWLVRAAVLADASPIVVEDADASTGFPAVASFHGPTPRLGRQALGHAVSYPRDTVVGVKRLLGRTHAELERSGLLARLLYPIEPGPGRGVALRVGAGTQAVEDVVAALLRLPLDVAEPRFGGPPAAVALAAPAWLGDAGRAALLGAARKARLPAPAIVDDAHARALTLAASASSEQIVVIVDVGAGGVSATAVAIAPRRVAVLGAAGDGATGGADVDAAIAAHLLARMAPEVAQMASAPGFAVGLGQAAQSLKHTLSGVERAIETLPYLRTPAGELVELVLDRAALAPLLADLVARVSAACAAVLEVAGLAPSSIDVVHATGGMVQVPAVRAAIEAAFGRRAQLRLGAESAACGAALRAGMQVGAVDLELDEGAPSSSRSSLRMPRSFAHAPPPPASTPAPVPPPPAPRPTDADRYAHVAMNPTPLSPGVPPLSAPTPWIPAVTPPPRAPSIASFTAAVPAPGATPLRPTSGGFPPVRTSPPPPSSSASFPAVPAPPRMPSILDSTGPSAGATDRPTKRSSSSSRWPAVVVPPAPRAPSTGSFRSVAPPRPESSTASSAAPPRSPASGSFASFLPPPSSGAPSQRGPTFRDYPRGSFVRPADAGAILAQPITRPLGPADCDPVALPVLLLRLVGLRSATGVLRLEHGPKAVDVTVIGGRAHLLKHEQAALVGAFAWSTGTYAFEEKAVADERRPPSLMIDLVCEGLRSLLRGCTADELDAALGERMTLAPALVEERRKLLPRLGLSGAETRLLEGWLDGRASGRDIAAQGGAGRHTTSTLFVLLVLFGMAAWGPVEARERESLADELGRKASRMAMQNHFEALGVHWSTPGPEIDQAYRAFVAKLGPGKPWYDASPEACQRMRRRADEAYKVLSDPAARIAHRAEAYPLDFEAITDLAERRASVLDMRGASDAAASQRDVAAELSRTRRSHAPGPRVVTMQDLHAAEERATKKSVPPGKG